MSEQNPFWRVGSAFRVDVTQLNTPDRKAQLNRTEVQRASPALSCLFSKPVVVTASSDWNAVSIFAEHWWDQLLPKIWRLPKDIPEARRFMRLMFGYAFRVGIDEQLVLPEALVSYGKLDTEGILLNFDEKYAEIWSESQLAALSTPHF